MQATQQLDKETQQKNLELQEQHKELTAEIAESNGILDTLKSTQTELIKSLDDVKESSQNAAKSFYNMASAVAQASFDKEVDEISNQLEQNRQSAIDDYTQLLAECVDNFQNEIANNQQELSALNVKLNDMRSKVDTAVAAAKRAQEMEEQRDFYKLQLSDLDIEEIKRLREVLPYLRDKEPLNKVIYKVYYEKPYTDLIGRVVGPGVHTGIYKITNIENSMVYVGQAANIAERWRQHIKRGVGAEAPTRNKLYPAMLSIGVENFTFEVVEECERQKLDEREDYWQEYFHAKDFGYSIK